MTVPIIAPAYNAEALITQSLTSAIRAGTRVPGKWELIAVVNGSTDRAPQMPREFVAGHGTILSTGGWLRFLDADGTIAPDKLSRHLSFGG